MSKTVRYYKLTEWPLVWRRLAIVGIILVALFFVWLVINLQWQFCPGNTNCETAPKHSLRNLL